MKALKLLFVVLLLAVGTSGTAFANGRGGHGGGHGFVGGHYGGGGLGRIIVPAMVGGVIGYGIYRAYAPAYYPQQCGYVQQPVFDQYGRQLFDQYGQPAMRVVSTCGQPMRY